MDVHATARKSALWLGILFGSLATGPLAHADPTFNVTDIGSSSDLNLSALGSGVSAATGTYLGTLGPDGVVKNSLTGVTYDFPMSVNHFDAANPDVSVPGTYIWYFGTNPPTPVFYPMKDIWENSQGSVIGIVPGEGSTISDSRDSPSWSYAFKQADGTLSHLTVVPDTNPAPAGRFNPYVSMRINDLNQVVITDDHGTYLQDYQFNHVPLDPLLPAAIRDDPKYFGMNILGFSNNGSILAQAVFTGGTSEFGFNVSDVFLLTPSGLPVPTPEPTNLATFLAASVGLVVRQARRRKSLD